jgi:hypothetical protein
VRERENVCQSKAPSELDVAAKGTHTVAVSCQAVPKSTKNKKTWSTMTRKYEYSFFMGVGFV